MSYKILETDLQDRGVSWFGEALILDLFSPKTICPEAIYLIVDR